MGGFGGVVGCERNAASIRRRARGWKAGLNRRRVMAACNGAASRAITALRAVVPKVKAKKRKDE